MSAAGVAAVCMATVFGGAADGTSGGRTVAGPYPHEVAGVAHRTWKIGTLVDVTFRGKTYRLPVVDRGPWGKTDAEGRWFNGCPKCADKDRSGEFRGCVDITLKAARRIGFTGRHRVKIRRVR